MKRTPQRGASARATKTSESFRDIFARHLRQSPHVAPPEGSCRTPTSRPCQICHASTVDYGHEVRSRETALQEFWRALDPGVSLSRLVASPRGRQYRTVSKRKAFPVKGNIRLGLIGSETDGGQRPLDVISCAIEPASHAAIYARVQESLLKPFARELAQALSYVVVKGGYETCIVILTVRGIEGALVRSANTLSKGLTHSCPEVKGVILYEDLGDGRYYLGTRNPAARGSIRKLFGEAEIQQYFGGKSFFFPALSFTQVNASLVDPMIEEAARMLALSAQSTFFDLYCGYGVFALTAGSAAKQCIGIERSPESIDAAIANAKRLRVGNVRFLRSDITAENLSPALARTDTVDAMLLDPPRGGTSAGVIECIAARRVGRVVHLFCAIDAISAEIDRWRKSGYRLRRAVPFDMFPGTDEVEVMVLLTPAT